MDDELTTDTPIPDQVEEPRATAYQVERAMGAIRRATGKRYRLDLSKLSARELDELERLVRDIEYEAENRAKSMVRRQPWRFMGS